MTLRIVSTVHRTSPSAITDLRMCYTGVVLDFLQKTGLVDAPIRSLTPGTRFCGPVVTCSGPDLDVRRMAIDLAKPGDVLLVAGADATRACFGSATALCMQANGMVGAVIDGAVRDVFELRRLGFPTFARSMTPLNFDYPVDLEDAGVNVPVRLGSQTVEPGDVLLGDDDGVVLIRRSVAESSAREILQYMRRKEVEHLQRVGHRYDVRHRLEQRGFIFE